MFAEKGEIQNKIFYECPEISEKGLIFPGYKEKWFRLEKSLSKRDKFFIEKVL